MLFIYSNKWVSKKEVGWTNKIKDKNQIIIIISIILFCRLAIRVCFNGIKGSYNVETFCYQATMPGLAQEIVYRGIFLGLLNRVFIRRFSFFKTKFGWGLFLTAIVFGCIHGLYLSKNWLPYFNSQKFIMATALGFVLGFIKEKSNSLVPSIVLHNLWNIIVFWH